ncbi:MAG: SPOR domain-containing protein [Polaromonas sp.]|nr:SPOR domain-containing protein [Polaromonas sp.]
MLRLLVLTLLLANLGFYVWSHGWLAAYGLAPAVETEPQRLTQQIRPDAMQLQGPPDRPPTERAPATAAVPAAPGECLQAGLFNEAQSGALRSRLQASLPPGSWSLAPGNEPARWMIYVGRFTEVEAMAIKRSELARLGVGFQPVSAGTLAPGLSLGSFTSQADADGALARLSAQGVRSARVLPEKPEQRGDLLTLPAVDASLRSQLDAIKPQLLDRVLRSCR